ncbi:uncharacterized protein A4U43_C07F21900 [Asparagus officinalis]|uniref:Uncharacterized protein n=1 Tax=Asparagus officinalis TaxID=4686 RepID=A0A5P1EE00_ASPOF|nr:uncharacterized protein A4U43_C07F21900 [Asparagus officinalis]
MSGSQQPQQRKQGVVSGYTEGKEEETDSGGSSEFVSKMGTGNGVNSQGNYYRPKNYLQILSVLTRKCNLEGEFNLMKIARATPGFVRVHLNALVNKAGNLAMRRIMEKRKSGFQEGKTDDWLRQPLSLEDLASSNVTMSDFHVL